MIKRPITIFLLAAASAASAQTMNDALNFSEYDYAGSARAQAMGNAVTAVGGDLGTIGINPAGLAVATCCQVVASMGIAIPVHRAEGVSTHNFGTPTRYDDCDFRFPNGGFSYSISTKRKQGIKNISLGIICNVNNMYSDKTRATGSCWSNSFSSAVAGMAKGLNSKDIGDSNAYGRYNGDDWRYILAYQAGIISPSSHISNTYTGIAENVNTWQDYHRSIYGDRYDCIVNAGINISDMIYLGANLGIAALTYSEVNTITEEPATQREYTFRQYYDVTGVGIYGKFGIIVTPYKGLRLGAAIQTPTSNSMKQICYMTAGKDNGSELRTYDAIWTYRLASPMRFNIGAAYTFGSLAMISADYEVCDYSSMKMAGRKYSKDTDFYEVNSEIDKMMGASHMARAGIEFNPVEWFSIRAGYGFTGKPGYYLDKNDKKRRLSSLPEANSHKYSFGIGYTNKELFYIDLSFTARHYGSEYITPYTVARRNSNGQIVTDSNGRAIPDYDASPCIHNNKWLWLVTYTLGYRF